MMVSPMLFDLSFFSAHSLTSAVKEELGEAGERARKEGAFRQSSEAAQEMVKWKRVVLGQAEGQRKGTLTDR